MILWQECESAEANTPLLWIDLPTPPDHYRTLGLQSDASHVHIKQAYRSLAQRFHPDTHPEADPSLAEELMKRLNMAYAVLRSAETRAAYDRSLGLHPR